MAKKLKHSNLESDNKRHNAEAWATCGVGSLMTVN